MQSCYGCRESGLGHRRGRTPSFRILSRCDPWNKRSERVDQARAVRETGSTGRQEGGGGAHLASTISSGYMRYSHRRSVCMMSISLWASCAVVSLAMRDACVNLHLHSHTDCAPSPWIFVMSYTYLWRGCSSEDQASTRNPTSIIISAGGKVSADIVSLLPLRRYGCVVTCQCGRFGAKNVNI